MNCSGCKKALDTKESMRCRLCVGKFHYQCLNMQRKDFVGLSEEQLISWMCPACCNVTRRPRSNDNTPVRRHQPPSVDDTMNMSCDNLDHSICASHPLTSTSITPSLDNAVTMNKIGILLDQKLNASLTHFMENFRAKIRDDIKEMVKIEMESAINVLKNEFTATTDFICSEHSSLREKVEEKCSTIKQLESENFRLQGEISKINSKFSALEKVTRGCNIELQAVPERRNENVLVLFKKLCDLTKVNIEDGQISACRRVAKQNSSSNRPRNIVVTLGTPRLRDLVLSAAQRYNKSHPEGGLTSVDLDIPGETRKVYVSEHLSRDQKSLHAATRRTAKEKSYKYVWIKYGQVYVRRDDTTSAILIKNLDSLEKL